MDSLNIRCDVRTIIGASLSEPHLVTTTAALSISHIVRRLHVITYSTRAHSMVVSFPDLQTSLDPSLPLRDRESDAACTCRDSSCGWYGLPGISIERSQASGSDKLTGGSKRM